MKKLLFLFLFCILLLSACGENTEESPPPAPDPAESAALPIDEGHTVSIDYLGLEFARDLYPPEELLTLARELAPLLRQQLALRGYEVKEIGCTVGSANLMTAQALNEGGVGVALLPADSYAQLCYDEARPVLAAAASEQLTCGIYAGESKYGAKLAKKSSLSLADLEKARWGISADASLQNDYASLYLSDHYEGALLGGLPTVTVYDTQQSLAAAAEAGEVDIAVLANGNALSLLFETEPIYSSLIAVTMQNDIFSSHSFVRALRESIFAILAQAPELLALYDIHTLVPVQNTDLDPARRVLTIT